MSRTTGPPAPIRAGLGERRAFDWRNEDIPADSDVPAAARKMGDNYWRAINSLRNGGRPALASAYHDKRVGAALPDPTARRTQKISKGDIHAGPPLSKES